MMLGLQLTSLGVEKRKTLQDCSLGGSDHNGDLSMRNWCEQGDRMGDDGEQKEGHLEWKLGKHFYQCRRVEQARSWGGAAQPGSRGAQRGMLRGWMGKRGVGWQRAGQFGWAAAGLRVTQQTKPPTLAWYF